MAKITDWLNRRPDGVYQLNISVKGEYAQELADALEFLKRREIMRSKSELATQAIIESARTKGLHKNEI